jgi:hypothetical protein
MYDNKFTFTEKFIEHVKKDIYFRNVHLFLKRVKNVIRVKNVNQVRQNLFICLRNLTLQWYISESSENIKNWLRYDNEIEYWKKELLKRFKKSVSVAMTSLIKKKYSMNDVKRRRKSREYADVILRVAKSTDLIPKISQIFLIYNEIDVKFQRNLSMSKFDIKLNNFLTELNDKKNVWWQLAERKRSDENSYEFSINIQNQNSYEYFRYATYQFEYQRFRNDRDESSRYLQYIESQRYDQLYDDAREYQSQKYQSRDYFNQSDNSSKSVSTSISYFNSISQNDINRNQKSSLNTDQTSNDNEYQSRSDSLKNTSSKNDSSSAFDQIRSNWNSRSIQFSLWSNEFDQRNDEYKSKANNAEMNESNLNQKYFHEDEHDEEYLQKEQDQNVSINFAEYDDKSNELYYEEIAMNSEKKYETFVEFVEIEVSCIKCKKIFSFRNKLHKHLKKNCQAIKSTKFIREKSVKSTNIKDSKTFAVTKSIIVKFTASTSDKDYELTFRKWNYVEALVKLESNL